MNNIFKQNTVIAIVFKLEDILLIMEGTDKLESNYYLIIGIGSHVTDHVIAMEKVAEQHILTIYSKCNSLQVISDLVMDFMNFNALKIILKIH